MHLAGQVTLPQQAAGSQLTEQPHEPEQLTFFWQDLSPQTTVHMPLPQVMSPWQASLLLRPQVRSQVVDLEQSMLPWQDW